MNRFSFFQRTMSHNNYFSIGWVVQGGNVRVTGMIYKADNWVQCSSNESRVERAYSVGCYLRSNFPTEAAFKGHFTQPKKLFHDSGIDTCGFPMTSNCSSHEILKFLFSYSGNVHKERRIGVKNFCCYERIRHIFTPLHESFLFWMSDKVIDTQV